MEMNVFSKFTEINPVPVCYLEKLHTCSRVRTQRIIAFFDSISKILTWKFTINCRAVQKMYPKNRVIFAKDYHMIQTNVKILLDMVKDE